jgi:hypothetical protein
MGAKQYQYHACYARARGIFSNESTAIHVMRGAVHGALLNIALGQDQYTLCGRLATRHIDIFKPSEATCRECKRRWQLAQPRPAPKTTMPVRPSIIKRGSPTSSSPVTPSPTQPSSVSAVEAGAIEAGALAIWAMTAKALNGKVEKKEIIAGWRALSASEQDRYRQMAKACIRASDLVRKKNWSFDLSQP